MKTTVDLPDSVFRKAKDTASERGISLKHFIIEAVESQLPVVVADPAADAKPWMSMLSELPRVSQEVLDELTRRVANADAADLALQGGARP